MTIMMMMMGAKRPASCQYASDSIHTVRTAKCGGESIKIWNMHPGRRVKYQLIDYQ